MKKIPVNKKIWRKIHQIKREQNFNSYSDIIEQILNSQSIPKGENQHELQQLDGGKILQNLGLDENTQVRIQKLMSDHNLNFSGLINHLIDCHSILKQEDTHQKLEEKDALQEIYNHIQQLQPSRKLEEELVVGVPPTVAISSPISEDQVHIDDTIEKKEFICCPFCRSSFPLLVELDQDGAPLKKHEDGIVYKEVKGVLQRRFRGPKDEYPNDNYLPIQTRIGGEIIVEESMAIGTLRHLDKDLFNDFVKTLESTIHKFTGVAYEYQW